MQLGHKIVNRIDDLQSKCKRTSQSALTTVYSHRQSRSAEERVCRKVASSSVLSVNLKDQQKNVSFILYFSETKPLINAKIDNPTYASDRMN